MKKSRDVSCQQRSENMNYPNRIMNKNFSEVRDNINTNRQMNGSKLMLESDYQEGMNSTCMIMFHTVSQVFGTIILQAKAKPCIFGRVIRDVCTN